MFWFGESPGDVGFSIREEEWRDDCPVHHSASKGAAGSDEPLVAEGAHLEVLPMCKVGVFKGHSTEGIFLLQNPTKVGHELCLGCVPPSIKQKTR